MKKIILALFMMSCFVSYSNAEESEFKTDFLNTFHAMCMSDQDVKTVANQLKTTVENTCACMEGQISILVDKNKIEQRLVSGNLSEEQFEKEMESYGEKAGDYCEKKLLGQTLLKTLKK